MNKRNSKKLLLINLIKLLNWLTNLSVKENILKITYSEFCDLNLIKGLKLWHRFNFYTASYSFTDMVYISIRITEKDELELIHSPMLSAIKNRAGYYGYLSLNTYKMLKRDLNKEIVDQVMFKPLKKDPLDKTKTMYKQKAVTSKKKRKENDI